MKDINYMEVADYTLVGAAAYAKGKTKPYDVAVAGKKRNFGT